VVEQQGSWQKRRSVSGYATPFLIFMLVTLLNGCNAPPPPAAPGASAIQRPVAGYYSHVAALLVAGDDSEAVFDNAVTYFMDQLASAGLPADRRHALSAVPHRPHGIGDASLPNLLAEIATLKPGPQGSCLVFMTSHGVPGQGFYLSRSDATLAPSDLDQALQQGCGTAPTVLIVSGCYSGLYDQQPLTRPNRIILTASAPDRASFGCGTGFIYTYFDDCLLGSLDGAPDWLTVYLRTRDCVMVRERQSGAEASLPQAWFGTTAGTPPVPWRRDRPPTPNTILFTPSTDGYNPHLVPLSPADRALMMDELNYYASVPAPKALALAPIGLAIAAAQDGSHKRTEDDVARLALERCEWLTGGACVLFARDDVTASVPSSGLPIFHPRLLVRAGQVTPATVPFIRDDQRPEIADYLALTGPKALALSPTHTAIGIGRGDTLVEARQDALARCQVALRDCLLYAENDTVVLN
jgi:hypothetical protein